MCSGQSYRFSGGFRAARLPRQSTRAIGLWVEKNPIPPPNQIAAQLDKKKTMKIDHLCHSEATLQSLGLVQEGRPIYRL